jgi:hypothetical protein
MKRARAIVELPAARSYRFPALSEESFNGLPGLLADSLPDRYGQALTVEDFRRAGEAAGLKRGQAERILAEVTEAVRAWPELASDAGIDETRIAQIERAQRLKLLRR